ncbi:MAG: hypothetical protein KJ847_03710 [Firmicutes bacterium]|nr:hypothetical protein [Bacillota bacterium]
MKNNKTILFEKLLSKKPQDLKMIVGFDGFIDEIIHAVDKRIDSETFTRIETLDQLAKRIEKASGLSTNIELFPTQKKIGGNGPIMCNALGKYHAQLTYIGALGVPNIDAVFSEMSEYVKIYSVANAAHTDALEFDDGKLMLGKMATLNEVTYRQLIKTVGKENFISLLSETNLFATVNWSMLPHMTDIWRNILQDILPLTSSRIDKPIFFIDLADPEKRESKEIIEALDLLKQFSSHFNVVLGLNKKEAYDIGNILELFDSSSLEHMQVSLEDLTTALYEYLSIYGVVIHPVDRSCTMINNMYYEETGPYVKKPKLTTGAGDNFNAGFVLGLMLGLNPKEALLTGMGTSGYYVRNAKSPDYKELIRFLDDWGNDLV